MAEEPGHDFVVSLTLVVIGSFGVGPSDGAGALNALVRHDFERCAE